MTLQKLYDKYYDPKTGWPDKNTSHSYLPVYEEILKPYRRKRDANILEIGLMSGESLRMWTEYFSGNVFGIDCSIKPIDGKADLTKAIEDGLYISIGDATNPADLERYYSGLKFDVVIDDGSHNIEDQVKTHYILKDYMAEGSIYIIEDIQDIDAKKHLFWEGEIIDRRHIKNRYDDVLVIYRK
jgi:hypothetical protein